MPELNRWLQIVEMENSVSILFSCIALSALLVSKFKFRLTTAMIIDFVGCWILEKSCKYLFANLEPKVMITRGRERREERRRLETVRTASRLTGAQEMNGNDKKVQ